VFLLYLQFSKADYTKYKTLCPLQKIMFYIANRPI
jgi:hypothetical protein